MFACKGTKLRITFIQSICGVCAESADAMDAREQERDKALFDPRPCS